ncbi:MAG: hypothetical protein JWN41_1633, partial [Thermoleophilia bacterium]|nr:hypothetical protein [Thermoleophilia bacterium]
FTGDAPILSDHSRLVAALTDIGDVRESAGAEFVIEVRRAELHARVGQLLALGDVADFTVEDEPLERVLERVFETPAGDLA